MSRVIDTVDVICQHKSNGEVIPLRFRLMNEDGRTKMANMKIIR